LSSLSFLTEAQRKFIVEKKFLSVSQEELLAFLRPILQQLSLVETASAFEDGGQFRNYRKDGIIALCITIVFGVLFTALQLFEYQTAPFTLADGIYGSTFFVTTGFHGLHVIIGTIFLIVCLFRHVFYHFLQEQHFGLEAAI
jgi:heme/copper-type cytochrome/quinol oxidase subunit 3